LKAPLLSLLALAYLAFVSLGLPDTVIGVAWPSIRDRFGLSQAALGAALSVGVSGYALSSVLAGRLVGRLGVGRLSPGAAGSSPPGSSATPRRRAGPPSSRWRR
jgi:MFS family permease